MYKTKNSILKNITYAAIGTALSFTSIQVSAGSPDDKMPSKLCFHIIEDPNHPDPLGSYLVLRPRQVGTIKLQGDNLKLRQVNGLSIGRAPDLSFDGTGLVVDWGEWVGNPITGTCHPHNNTFQCSLHSISSITTSFPFGEIHTSIETARGDATIVYDKKNDSIVLAQRGEVDVTYFDGAGLPFSEDDALSLYGLKSFKKIANFIKSPNITEVKCKKVPHAGIPSFTVPMP